MVRAQLICASTYIIGPQSIRVIITSSIIVVMHGIDDFTCMLSQIQTTVCNAHHIYLFITLGTNKYASQKGMSMGAVRHVSDIKADDLCMEGQGHIGLQAGSNAGASQKGMSFGKGRGVSDLKISKITDDYDM